MKHQYLETGKFVGTHGIKGELRVQPWCNEPLDLCKIKTLYLDNQGTAIKINSSRVHGNVVLMKIDGVDTIEDAEKLRGKTVYLSREDLKIGENDWFVQDLIGCSVFDADTNELLGILSDVSQTGANDVWHIKKDDREYLVPAIKEVVISVDINENKVELRPIKGIFDDED